jgi:hypothetical protein
VLRGNYVHDNNNPDSPASGISGAAPVGTGIELVGTQNDSVIGNRVENNSSWGIVAHDFPDTETPPPEANCQGGVPGPGVCLFQSTNNEVIGNQLAHNGASGNPSNGDLANESTGVPGNCFQGNVASAGTLMTDPPGVQSLPCPQPGDEVVLSVQLVCASQALGDCPGLPGATYPRTHGDAAVRQGMVMPPPQPSMPDPCAGTPPNAYCGTASAGAAAASRPAVRAAPVLPATGGGGAPLAAGLAAVGVAGVVLSRSRGRGRR